MLRPRLSSLLGECLWEGDQGIPPQGFSLRCSLHLRSLDKRPPLADTHQCFENNFNVYMELCPHKRHGGQGPACMVSGWICNSQVCFFWWKVNRLRGKSPSVPTGTCNAEPERNRCSINICGRNCKPTSRKSRTGTWSSLIFITFGTLKWQSWIFGVILAFVCQR